MMFSRWGNPPQADTLRGLGRDSEVKDPGYKNLPRILVDYIDSLIKGVGANRRVRLEVAEEIGHHFVDAMDESPDDEAKEESARELMENFGDVKMLGRLIKRGKKRCRPLWQKVLVRSLLGLCGLIVFFVLYAIWFFTGEATFSVNYLVRMNEMARPKMAAKDNGWTDYEKAIELYVAPDEEMKRLLPETPWSQLSPKQHKVFSDWVDQNEQAWEQYAAGSRKFYCFREYSVNEGDDEPLLVTILMPHLMEMRDLSKLGVSLSRKHLEEGDIAQAVDACLAVIRCGRHWPGNRTLIEQLVGWGIERTGYDQMTLILDSTELPAAQLSEIQQQLNNIASKGYPEVAVEFERIAFFDTIQHIFTKGGPGGGHIIPKAYQMFDNGDEPLAYMRAGLIHAGRNRTVAVGNRLYDQMEKMVKLSPYQRNASDDVESVEDVLKTFNKHRYSLLWIWTPAFERVCDIRYRGKATFEATQTLVGIKRWEKEKGSPPESLEQLKEAGYLRTLPDDPYSDGVLRYIKKENDFVLYSIGEDFQDNGGKENPDKRWGRKGGDRVFWPLDSEKWDPVKQGIDDQ